MECRQDSRDVDSPIPIIVIESQTVTAERSVLKQPPHHFGAQPSRGLPSGSQRSHYPSYHRTRRGRSSISFARTVCLRPKEVSVRTHVGLAAIKPSGPLRRVAHSVPSDIYASNRERLRVGVGAHDGATTPATV